MSSIPKNFSNWSAVSGIRVVFNDSSHQDFINTATHYYWRREVGENEREYAMETGEYPGYFIIYETDSRTGKFKKVSVIPDWNVEEIQLIN